MAKKKPKKTTKPEGRQWDYNDPLESIDKETVKSNAAMRDYALMGPGRSFQALTDQYREISQSYTKATPAKRRKDGIRKPPTIHISSLKNWSRRWDWVARVARWDVIQSDGQREVYQRRQLEIREKDWELGEKLRDKVYELIDDLENFKTTETIETMEDGERVRVITVKLNTTVAQLANAGKKASDIQRSAVDLPTEIIAMSGEALNAEIERELAALSDIQKDIADRKSKSDDLAG